MSADEAALVRAILSDPRDDLARAAYADWLEEQALPLHAEFMRLPLPAHGRMPVESLGDRIERALTRDGGVYPNRSADGLLHVQVQMRVFRLKAFQKYAPAVLRGEHVVRLCLDGRVSDWRRVAESPVLASVPGLSLAGCDLRKGGAAALAASPALPTLWSLTLSRRQRVDEAETFCAAPLPALVHLDLSQTRVTPDALRALAAGPAAGRLRHLNLHSGRIGGEGAALLAGSPALLGGLVTLSLVECGLRDEAIAPLFTSRHLCNLRSLNLAYNALTDAALFALASSPLAARLGFLHFSRCAGYTSAGLRALADALPAGCRVWAWHYLGEDQRRELSDLFGDRLA